MKTKQNHKANGNRSEAIIITKLLEVGYGVLDREAIEYLGGYLGVLVGYLSGPLPVVVQQQGR